MNAKKLKLLLAAVAALVLAMALFGCSSSTSSDTSSDTSASGDGETASSDDMTLTIGSGPQDEVINQAAADALEEMGYTVEVQVFDDYQTPDRALAEGSIDANMYQHKPFLEDYNSANNTDLAFIDPPMWNYFRGLYSQKYDSIDDIPDGATIALATEATNIDIEFQNLQKWGLITIADEPSADGMYTEVDVVDNPKNLQFIYVDDTQRYANGDQYDAYTGASDRLFTEGYDPSDNLLERIDSDSDWALGLVVNSADKDADWVQDLMTAYTCAATEEAVTDQMKGAYFLTDDAKAMQE